MTEHALNLVASVRIEVFNKADPQWPNRLNGVIEINKNTGKRKDKCYKQATGEEQVQRSWASELD